MKFLLLQAVALLCMGSSFVQAMDVQQQEESLDYAAAAFTTYLKKTLLSFHHMDEYHLEVTTMAHIKQGQQCSYQPKAQFYTRVVQAFSNKYVTEDTAFLVVTACKGTIHKEMRKVFIPLTWGEFIPEHFTWNAHKQMWALELFEDYNYCGTVLVPLDFMTTDQEIIEREDALKIYFAKDAWEKELKETLTTCESGEYKRFLKKYCCSKSRRENEKAPNDDKEDRLTYVPDTDNLYDDVYNFSASTPVKTKSTIGGSPFMLTQFWIKLAYEELLPYKTVEKHPKPIIIHVNSKYLSISLKFTLSEVKDFLRAWDDREKKEKLQGFLSTSFSYQQAMKALYAVQNSYGDMQKLREYRKI